MCFSINISYFKISVSVFCPGVDLIKVVTADLINHNFLFA